MAETRKKAKKESEEPKKKAPVRRKKEVKLSEAVAPAAEVKHEVPPPPPAPVPAKPKAPKISGPKYYGTGRRKESVAKVWLTPGCGKVVINRKPMAQYLCGRKLLESFVNRPLAAIQLTDKYDVFAEASGGGIPGQAGAVGLGVARALVQLNPDFKVLLKRTGLLTRDPRMKERKKYGLKRARKAFQYSKR